MTLPAVMTPADEIRILKEHLAAAVALTDTVTEFFAHAKPFATRSFVGANDSITTHFLTFDLDDYDRALECALVFHVRLAAARTLVTPK